MTGYETIKKYGIPLEILCPKLVGNPETKLAGELFRKRYLKEPTHRVE